jgi:hypothetical protein
LVARGLSDDIWLMEACTTVFRFLKRFETFKHNLESKRSGTQNALEPIKSIMNNLERF